jgi:transposase
VRGTIERQINGKSVVKMTVYSMDFRKKIVNAYAAGGTSIRKVAERFMVTKRTVQRLVKQYKEKGDLSAKKPGSQRDCLLEQGLRIYI